MTTAERPVCVWGIVPAAGLGLRMGRAKQSLPYRKTTLTGAVVRTLLTSGVKRVVVVTRTPLLEALALPDDPAIHVAFNNDSASQMIDSVRVGLARLEWVSAAGTEPQARARASIPVSVRARPPDGGSRTTKPCTSSEPADTIGNEQPRPRDGIVVVPADMPSLSADTCRRCVDAYVGDPGRIIIATHAARRAHPIIFPLSMRSAVEGLNGGLNTLPMQFPEQVTLVEVDDPGTVVDVDTPADYDRLHP